MTETQYFCSMPDWWRLMIWDRIEKNGTPEHHTHCGFPEIPCTPIQQMETKQDDAPIALISILLIITFFVIFDKLKL
jgi:hypothetical protein